MNMGRKFSGRSNKLLHYAQVLIYIYFILLSTYFLNSIAGNNFSVSMTIIDMVVPKHSKVLI